MLFLASMLTVTAIGTARPAIGHSSPFSGNSVDSSTSPAEMRYTTSSKYSGAVSNAIDKWNAIPGGVRIRPDTSSTINDVSIGDVHSSDTYHGRYRWWCCAVDTIRFNKRYLDQGSWDNCHRWKTALHEFGHAHDLGHAGSFSDPNRPHANSVMNTGKSCRTGLASHDVSDYNNRWD